MGPTFLFLTLLQAWWRSPVAKVVGKVGKGLRKVRAIVPESGVSLALNLSCPHYPSPPTTAFPDFAHQDF